jgi:hypothetical protein
VAVWQDTDDGHYCTVHDYAFKRLEVCHECVTADGFDGSPAPIAQYDVKQLARIAEYRSTARELKRVGLEMCCGTDRDANAGIKLIAESTKLFRLAEERQEVLDNREHDLVLIRHEEAMSGGARGSN